MLSPYKKHNAKNYKRITAEITMTQVYMFPVTYVLERESLKTRMNGITRLKNALRLKQIEREASRQRQADTGQLNRKRADCRTNGVRWRNQRTATFKQVMS